MAGVHRRHAAQHPPGDRGLRHGDRDRRPGQLRYRLHLHPGRPRRRYDGPRTGDLRARVLAPAGRAGVSAGRRPRRGRTRLRAPDSAAGEEGVRPVIGSRREAIIGRALLVLLMAFTILPFVSLFTTALQPSGTYPPGLEWPAHPQWGNFTQAFKAAQMGRLLESSVLIVVGVVPVSVLIATMAGFALGHLRMPGSRVVFLLFLLGLTLPFEGVITPL